MMTDRQYRQSVMRAVIAAHFDGTLYEEHVTDLESVGLDDAASALEQWMERLRELEDATDEEVAS